jgi:uncharacterized protein (TIGR00369 family)
MSSQATDEATTLFLHTTMPFAALLGLTVLSSSPAETRLRLDWNPRLCTVAGALHGGVIMAAADCAAASVAFLNLPEGARGTTTVTATSHFFRPVRDGHIEAVARPAHLGRTLFTAEVVVLDAGGQTVAITTQTQAVLR